MGFRVSFADLVAGLVADLVAGLVTGLVAGLIAGLVAGLVAELLAGSYADFFAANRWDRRTVGNCDKFLLSNRCLMSSKTTMARRPQTSLGRTVVGAAEESHPTVVWR
ncbi:hypothetical protein K0M31_002240 [Melipona bicolor]|uniref:Uncharacterized protein n=1 Tax=Melipona bicolor TaxID=60889 RepID=A0AA40GH60_9HYME|nr:hypothetical protein K0M31_002240 [Melipona bicolor]